MSGEIILYLVNPTGDKYIIPIFDGYNVSLNLSFTDLESFKPTGAYSNTFRCPLDTDFQSFIGAINDVNYDGWFNPKNKIPAYITADTIPFSEGFVEISDVIKTSAGYEIEVRYFGETPDIKSAMGALRLQDISTLAADLNHLVDYDNITDDTLQSSNVNYFLVDKGQNFSEQGEAGTRPIFNEAQPLYASDFTPCVKARYLWDKIISEAGFVVDSPSSFEDRLDSLWIPWLNGTLSPISTAEPSAENFILSLGSDLTVTPQGNYSVTVMGEEFDNGGNVSSNVFTAPFSGVFNFRYWITFRSTLNIASSIDVQTRLYNPSTSETLDQGPVVSITMNLLNQRVYREASVQLDAGDDVVLRWSKLSSPPIILNGTTNLDYEIGTGFELYEIAEQYSGYTADMVANAPNMTQFDFFSSIAKMYNLIIVPDRNVPNKLRIESMMDYLQSGSTLDWTSKLDLSKDVSVKPTTALQSKDLIFTYREDGDALNKIYKDEGDRVFGTLDSTNSQLLVNLQSDFASGTNTTKLGFAPTPCNNILGTSYPIPKLINAQGGLFKAKPRILFHAYSFDNVKVYDDDTTTVTDTTVRVLSHFDNYDIPNEEPGAETFDLNFGQEFYLQQTAGAPFKNLFHEYWKDYIREIYDPTARVMTAHFALDISDFLNFDFSDVIWIKNAYWRVLDISGYGVGLNTPTKVRLIKILSLDTDCGWSPYQSLLDGQVTFISSDGITTGAGTEECCTLYGYTWDTAKCYWNTPQGGFAPGTAGLKNFGFGSGNTRSLPSDSIAYVSNSDISPGNFGGKYGGNAITSGHGNIGSIMHGQDLEADDNIGSFAVFGKNAKIEQAGIHLGGGITDDGVATTIGRAQAGTVLFFGDGLLEDVDDSFETLLNGDSYLSLPNQSTWGVTVSVALEAFNIATSVLDNVLQQNYYIQINKSNGVARVTATQIAPNNENGDLIGHIELGIDVTTDTTQHRFSLIASSAASLPSVAINATVRVDYTQVKE